MNIKKKFEILTYNIGFISKKIDLVMKAGIQKGDIIWLKHDYKDRFFADPFMLKIDKDYFYILCEELTFWEEKGRIVLLKVDKKKYVLVERKIIIDEKTHLSFPFCELNGNKIYPESSSSGKYYEYTIDLTNFEIKNKKLLLDEGLVDAILYEQNNEMWLLGGKLKNPSGELYVYKNIDEEYVSISTEPVLNGNTVTRSAGRIFEWQGKKYRPVQDCKKRYGHRTKIMELLELNDNEYKAREYKVLESFNNPPFNETMHTFNVYNECILVDGSRDEFRFPMKFFYKKCSFLFKNKL